LGLQISIREFGDIIVLDLRGRSTVNDSESETLSRYLRKLISSDARKLLLNVADLEQIDSSGISVIIDTYVSLRDKGGELKLLRPGGSVLEVLRVLRLLEVIPSFEDENQAVASFRPRRSAAYCPG
jgi:anti-sigma B factor antagonist